MDSAVVWRICISNSKNSRLHGMYSYQVYSLYIYDVSPQDKSQQTAVKYIKQYSLQMRKSNQNALIGFLSLL